VPNTPDGLRFDVYERVHLSEDVAGIEELDEIELTPHIQVITQGEQILLRGNLLLTGSYNTGGQDRLQQGLEHWIPVEITLPLHRVHRLEDISVEIDNFDVDLLSTRTLNITGVLSLRGLQIEQAGAYPSNWEEEQITVVHRTWQSAEASLQPQRQLESEVEQASDPESAAFQPSDEASWPGAEQEHEQAAREPWAAQEGWAGSQYSAPAERQPQPLLPYGSPARRPEQQRPEAPPQRSEQAVPGFGQSTASNGNVNGNGLGQVSGFPQQSMYGASYDQPQPIQGTEDEREQPGVEPAQDELAWGQGAPAGATPFAYEAAIREPEAGQPADRQTAGLQPESERTPQLVPEASIQTAAPEVPQPQPQPQQPQTAVPVIAAPHAEAETEADAVSISEAQPSAEVIKTEMKIALSGKESGSDSFGISSLLQSNRREQEAKALARQQEQREQQEAEQQRDPAEEVQWKKLFLSKQNEEREFRKVRICIVQREETLETIAGRYQLNPREIVLYNRLPDPSVTEGQMLYIP